jgi:hypothetical protein
MRFVICMISSLDGSREDKELSEEELTGMVGSFIVSRAKDVGQTNTTMIVKGQSYKMQIKAIK